MRMMFVLESDGLSSLHVGRAPDLARREASASRGVTTIAGIWLPTTDIPTAALIAEVEGTLARFRVGPSQFATDGTTVAAAVDKARRRLLVRARLRSLRTAARRILLAAWPGSWIRRRPAR